jgi:multidrug efflux pump subunit AcrA (membrane-fusion protein)
MSEIHDISEAETHTIPVIPPPSSDLPMDFGPLIEDDTDDFDFIQATPPARPKRKRWIVWLSIVLLVVLLGGGIFTYRVLARPAPVTYTQTAVTSGNLSVSVSGTGPVQAGAVYNLNFTSSALVSTINVKVGQQVKKGDVLATLDPTSLQDAINQAQNSVNSAQTSVNSASSSLSNARSQRNTALDLAKIAHTDAINACNNPTPPNPPLTGTALTDCKKKADDNYNQAVNQANGSVTSASNQLTSAVQQRTSAQQQLQTAKNNLLNANLIAPHDGVITSVNGLVGESAGGGGSSGSGSSGNSGGSSAFIVLVDASTLNIAAQINEANIASVAVDQPATFTVAAYPSQTFRANVTGIDTLGATSSSVVTYQVNLAVDLQSINSAHVYPGMTATVSITTAERIGVLLVPATALSFSTTAIQNGELSRNALRSLISSGSSTTGTSTTTGSQGIVVELKNGQLVPVLVKIGLSNGQFTEVLSGLNEGDQVIVGQTGGKTTTTSSSPGGSGAFPGGGGGGGFPGGGRGGNGG